jgi:hypothetical protein
LTLWRHIVVGLTTPQITGGSHPRDRAELLCPDPGPGVRRIQHPRGKEARVYL